jgi:hypothetical protein
LGAFLLYECLFIIRSDRIVQVSGSRWTVCGENAGTQTARYSAPPGVLYRTHSLG